MICQSCSFSPHNDSVKRIRVLWQRTTKKKRTQKVYNRSKMTSSYFPNENHSTITNVTPSVPSHECSITERSSRNVKHNLNYHHRYHYPNNNKNTGTAITKITELYPLKVSYDYQHDDERLWLSPPRRRGPLIIGEVPHDTSAAALTTTVRLPTPLVVPWVSSDLNEQCGGMTVTTTTIKKKNTLHLVFLFNTTHNSRYVLHR